jgi:hypothetical protein
VIGSSSTEFTARDGRRFAFPVGVAFLVISGVLWWRDHQTALRVTATLGTLLIVAGVLAPGKLGPVYRVWMAMALAISKVTTPIFMGIVYYVVMTPTGLIMRMFGKKPITHSLADGSFWQSTVGRTKSDLRRQF